MNWLFKLLGKDGSSQQIVDPVHFAARVSSYPMHVGARGAYSASFYTGVIAAGLGANSELFQFRFVHASLFALLRSVKVSAAVSTTAFAAGVPITLEGRIARSWTAVGTGGTGITWGTNDGKKRTDFATTALGANDVRIATTAALGAGTKTLDGVPFGTVTGQVGTSVATIIQNAMLWQRGTADEWPYVFENQEGFVVRAVEVPGTGTWKAAVHVEWEEVDPSVIEGWV